MADVINRITKQYQKSVNTPDYPESEWIINPVMPDCEAKYIIIDGDNVREMTAEEKAIRLVDASTEEDEKLSKELVDREKADADKIEAREAFLTLSVDEKLLYLYEGKSL